jgi:hypothetical protein
MQIKLKQAEIERAIRAYVNHMGVSLANKDVKIDFTAGRGETGLVADVDIEEAAEGAQAAPAAPAVVAEKPKAVLTAVATASVANDTTETGHVGGIPEVAEASAEVAPAGKSLFA